MSKQMICPKAKDGSCPVRLEARYKHCNIHCHEESCNHPFAFSGQVACPACVEVEPQQEARKHDPYAWNKTIQEMYLKPSQVQEQCPECAKPRDGGCLMECTGEEGCTLDCFHRITPHPEGIGFCSRPCRGHVCKPWQPKQPTPTLREQMNKIVQAIIKESCPEGSKCPDNEGDCTNCYIDTLESAVNAEWNRNLEEIAEGITTICSGCEGDERQREHFGAYILQQREG